MRKAVKHKAAAAEFAAIFKSVCLQVYAVELGFVGFGRQAVENFGVGYALEHGGVKALAAVKNYAFFALNFDFRGFFTHYGIVEDNTFVEKVDSLF